MGIGVSLLLVAAGAILVWGVSGDIGNVNEDAIGWAGPGYWSRRRGGYVDEAPPPGPGY